MLNLNSPNAICIPFPFRQVAGAIIPITTFVGLGLEHSVANMFFIPMAMALGGPITIKGFLVRQSFVLLN